MPRSTYIGRDLVRFLRGCAKLYQAHLKNYEDLEFEGKGGRIIYIVDNDVLGLYAQPYQNPEFARIFPRIASRRKYPQELGGDDEPEDLLRADAWDIASNVFERAHNRRFLLIEPYRNELMDTISALGRRTGPRQLIDNHGWKREAAAILESASGVTDPEWRFNAYLRLADVVPIEVLFAADPSSTPTARINALLEKHTLLAPPEDLQSRVMAGEMEAVWADACDWLLERKRRRGNAINDASAIASCVALNRYSGPDADVRYLLLSGDHAIQEYVDATYGSHGPGELWPEFNFSRHPLQMSSYLGFSKVETTQQALAMRSLDLVLSVPLREYQTQQERLARVLYGDAVEIREHWDRALKRRPSLKRIMAFLVDRILSEVSRIRRAALMQQGSALSIFRTLDDRAGRGSGNDDGHFEKALSKLLVDGIQRSTQELGKAASMLGTQLQLARETKPLDDALRLAFLAAERSAGIMGGTAGDIMRPARGRLPCMPRLDARTVSYLRAIVDDTSPAKFVEYYDDVAGYSASYVYLANAVLASILGHWSYAEQQCRLGLEVREEEADASAVMKEEFLFFIAVAIRQQRNPGALRLRKGYQMVTELCLDLREGVSDLRICSERAAYVIGYYYHRYFYGGDYLEHKIGVEIEEVVQWVSTLHGRYISEYTEPSSELGWRLGTQIYTNACLLYLLDERHIGGLPLKVPAHYPIDEYYERLLEMVRMRGGKKAVSYFVQFVIEATDWFLKGERGDGGERQARNVDAILEMLGHEDIADDLIPYDRRKFDDFLRVAKVKRQAF